MKADLTASVENEWLSMAIARGYGLTTADCEMATFEARTGGQAIRFRRRATRGASGWIVFPKGTLSGHQTPADQKCQRDEVLGSSTSWISCATLAPRTRTG